MYRARVDDRCFIRDPMDRQLMMMVGEMCVVFRAGPIVEPGFESDNNTSGLFWRMDFCG